MAKKTVEVTIEMTYIHWAIAGGLTLAFILILWSILRQPEISYDKCDKSRSLCDMEWRRFWESLQKAAGHKRLVLSWIPMPLLIKPGDKEEALANWLHERWVDFVVLDDGGYMPVAVVQFERTLEDEHGLWAPGRDSMLEKVLEQAGLPLLWLPGTHYRDLEILRHALEQLWSRQQVAAASFGKNKDVVSITDWLDD
ncbi:MAG: DUF2726 domain-containing protein [Firmicutes bacterium]|nr:DUF2726 domain-containing protein [Bacillota bacterium]